MILKGFLIKTPLLSGRIDLREKTIPKKREVSS